MAYRFPVLVWGDYEGLFTACPVEREGIPLGIGRTADEAVAQVKECLAWLFREYPWLPEPDFEDARLEHFKVDVRPEYLAKERIFPSRRTIPLRIACVHGRQESGLLVASLPTIDVRFYYYEPTALAGLVARYVEESLRQMEPRDLAQYLPPKRVRLEEIVLNVVAPKRRQAEVEPPTELAAVAEPLGDRAVRRQFAHPWERDAEVADLVRRIGSERANVILVGESGVGKTSVLVEAVRRIERETEAEETDDNAQPRKFWSTSGARLIAGMAYLGQWEARCELVVEELSDIGGVLCVENLLDLLRSGDREPTASIASFLLPFLQRGELRLVGEATPSELDACRRLLPGFVDVFQVLRIEPFGRDRAVAALSRVAEAQKMQANLGAWEGVPELVYRLFRRFRPYDALPGRATAFVRAVFERAARERADEVGADRVIAQFVRETGLPELFLRDEVPLFGEEVADVFRREVMGQDEAVASATNLVLTFKAGLNDPARPIAVLLFCGPTGVGKTEMAKAISRYFFGHGETSDRLVRLDMSEYGVPGSASRLVTALDGSPSDLIERVRQQPFVVLLLDEIEKAHPEVFDMLLGLFDEGRLTDRYGRTATFRSAIVLMTSNIGASTGKAIGFQEAGGASYEHEVRAWFRPEFFNRIDGVVTFGALGPETARAIVRKELAAISGREGLERAGLRLEWTDEVVSFVAEEGFDIRYGARPLQRTIETHVVAPLARFLIEHANLQSATIRASMGADRRILFSIDPVAP